jgi:hypothetical protein
MHQREWHPFKAPKEYARMLIVRHGQGDYIMHVSEMGSAPPGGASSPLYLQARDSHTF